jgi:predicted lipoprotein with Yx(FWY)xxD motif
MGRRGLVLIAVAALVVAACSSDDEGSGGNGGPAVKVSSSSLGEILTDESGNTLYLFVPDGAGPSVCNDDCAAAWPPLTESVTAGDGADSALLGTAARDDGTEQATYNGWPLYYFASDAEAGDTNGQGLNDVWFVISPEGEAVQ